MSDLAKRLGIWPTALLGAGLLVLGLLALNHIVDKMWPFDVNRLDLVRATALDRVDATSMLDAANGEVILAFLAAVLVTITGAALPLAYFLNRRFGVAAQQAPQFLVTLRQAMWVGFWGAFCVWLQMNRTLSLPVAALVAIVLILFEFLLQVRTRVATAVS
jgi:hypothetical protein